MVRPRSLKLPTDVDVLVYCAIWLMALCSSYTRLSPASAPPFCPVSFASAEFAVLYAVAKLESAFDKLVSLAATVIFTVWPALALTSVAVSPGARVTWSEVLLRTVLLPFTVYWASVPDCTVLSRSLVPSFN